MTSSSWSSNYAFADRGTSRLAACGLKALESAAPSGRER
jgi:hypothetical protein